MKVRIPALLTLILIIILSSYIVQATNVKKLEEVDKSLVEELFSQRIEAMNEAFFNEDVEIEHTVSLLQSFEVDEILSEDIEIIRLSREDPSDLDYVYDVKVKEITCVSTEENIYRIKALVEWDLLNYTRQLKEEYYYDIDILKKNNKFYLKNFNVVL